MRITDYRSLFIHDTPLIDVRAPIEFLQGSLPGARNFPILNDDERAQVGTTYKEQGPEAATALGHQLVSGSVKEERLAHWARFIQENPQAVLYCFRGGQRSQITQRWLKEAGLDRPLIQGGYKAVRQFLMEETDRVSQAVPWLVISGPTGSGKTEMVQKLAIHHSALDLEDIAKHKGSAFGAMDEPQPTQIDFENQLAARLLKLEERFSARSLFLVEDESRMIGARHLPALLFEQMRAAKVVWIEDPMDVRVERILNEYVRLPLSKNPEPVFAKFKKAVQAINKRLGGLRAQEVLKILDEAEAAYQKTGDLEINRVWIELLLVYYYDPVYLKSLEKRQVGVAFRGSFEACQKYIESRSMSQLL
jgi:tRNA 2-selenouridine synthase